MRWEFVVAALVLAAPFGAHASLGGQEDTVSDDQAALHATHIKAVAARYNDHTVTSASSTVHEYANTEGLVFAVTWRGMARPDLESLFGVYYSEYQTENAKMKHGYGRQFTTVKSANVVVHRGGHMRDINGRAYIPSLVPAGVDVESLP